MHSCLRIQDNKKERHDTAVERLYDRLRQYVTDDSFYDAVLKEVEYFAYGIDGRTGDVPYGELDIGLIDWNGTEIRYIEVKTTKNGKQKAKRQLYRARDFFQFKGYDFVGDIVVVDADQYQSGIVATDSADPGNDLDHLFNESKGLF